jgi:glycosyltransferase involved in cell wall biosynthesis
VFLAGWRAHELLPHALNAADLLVLPSLGEAFGLVLIEAMACGLPVVACASHGPAAIVADGKTGWLVPPDGVDALADALLAAGDAILVKGSRSVGLEAFTDGLLARRSGANPGGPGREAEEPTGG